MSRNASALFGKGGLDEVALYSRALNAGEIDRHTTWLGRQPAAPRPPSQRLRTRSQPNHQVTFDASGSTDPDGTIVKYEWDLDGNGSYETNTGATPTADADLRDAKAKYTVGLRVTDDGGATANEQPSTSRSRRTSRPRLLHRRARPGTIGNAVSFDASGSTDPDGTIVKYEWDLDGNGSYETDTGLDADDEQDATSTPATSTVGLRVTDDAAKRRRRREPSRSAPSKHRLRRGQLHPRPARLLAPR